MLKGNEILTIAELEKYIDSNNMFYINNTLIQNNNINKYYLDIRSKYYHALPDYKGFDQRVFDGVGKEYTNAVIDKLGYLRLFKNDSAWELPIEDGYEPKQTLKRDFTSDGFTLDEAKQFQKNKELEILLPSGWKNNEIGTSALHHAVLKNYRRKPQVKTFQNTHIGRTFFDDIKINGVTKKIELIVVESDSCNGCCYEIEDCCPQEAACFKEKHISGKSVKAVKVEKEVTKRDILERIIEHGNCNVISCHGNKHQYNAGVPCPLLSYTCSGIRVCRRKLKKKVPDFYKDLENAQIIPSLIFCRCLHTSEVISPLYLFDGNKTEGVKITI